VLASIESRFSPQVTPCYTWGEDVSILAKTSKSYGIRNPLRNPVDLALVFQGAYAAKQRVALSNAVELLGQTFDGVAYGALPDARNTAHVHAELRRRIRSEQHKDRASAWAPQGDDTLSAFGQKLSAYLRKA
jgi:inhibitor of KinA sporulation pathway (predicted exonuclease)